VVLPQGVSELVALPYDDRQKVIVVRDQVWEKEHEARQAGTVWKPSAGDYAKVFIPFYGWFQMTRLLRQGLKLTKQLKSQALAVVPIRETDAVNLRFSPPGHPRRNILYLANPVEPGLYYPAADFHRLTFEHKVAEAVDILSGLGAVQIEARHEAGWGREVAASISLPVPTQVPGQIGASAARRDDHETQVMFMAELPPPTGASALPSGLRWFRDDQLWERAYRVWQERGLHELAFSVRYRDDFNVTASLAASAAQIGLKLGGKFEAQQDTEWRVRGVWDARPGA
jgi:hypothetical protein